MVNIQKKHRNGKDIIKPQCVLSYNKGMGGVDRSDQQASTYQCVRKCLKWYKKLFFYVLYMCIVNSYLLHVELTRIRLTLLDFQLKLVATLFESSFFQLTTEEDVLKALIVQFTCLESIFLAIYPQPRQKKDHSIDALCAHQNKTKRIHNINVKPVLCPCVLYHASRITTRSDFTR